MSAERGSDSYPGRCGVRSLGVLIVAVMATMLAACEAGESRSPTTPTSPSAALPGRPAAGCPAPAAGVQPRAMLVPGPSKGIPLSTATSDRLNIIIMVLDSACRPAANARLTVQHTDGRGEYGPVD